MIRKITLTDMHTGKRFKISPSNIILPVRSQRNSPCASVKLYDGYVVDVRESVSQVKAKLKPFEPKDKQTELEI